MVIPRVIKVKQLYDKEHIEKIEEYVRNELVSANISFRNGSRIAIAVGSRGISNIHRIVKAASDWVKHMGGEPFIVPAMGSHGGATAQGQTEVLESYGITGKYVGAPVLSSMQVVELNQGGLTNKVYMDKYAYEADGTIVINRIKVHTDFHGTTESGLMKMCVIGLGKHKQALEMHKYGVYGLRELIPITARQVLKEGNIIMGIGIVENAYDQTLKIKAVKPEAMEQEEIQLLDISRKNMPGIPVGKLDVLIVDEMGKDISGVGIDSNIIGRLKIKNEIDPGNPEITNIVVTDLTEASHGNALGMGLADFVTRRLYDKIDFQSTYENVLTSTFIERGKLPIVAETDRLAVEYALRTCGPVRNNFTKLIRIKNTLRLDEMYVSEAVLKELEGKAEIEAVGDYVDLFDKNNLLVEF